jgi:hypothetical protein
MDKKEIEEKVIRNGSIQSLVAVKKIVRSGTSGHIILPSTLIGKRAIIIYCTLEGYPELSKSLRDAVERSLEQMKEINNVKKAKS